MIDCKASEGSGRNEALSLFRRAAVAVPAYKDFLSKQHFDPRDVKSIYDFELIPITNKRNYVEQYSLSELSWYGDPCKGVFVHASSGTGGSANYWPCSDSELVRASAFYDRLFRNEFGVGSRFSRTLVIVCFGMGTWIAGSYTSTALLLLKLKGLPISIVTPGFNRTEAVRILKQIGPAYDQIIIAGIPSFVKDLLDSYLMETPIHTQKISLLLSGEGFPESWRSHVQELTQNPDFSVYSILGSADAGLVGIETTATVALRRAASENASICQELFEGNRVPAVMQYDPSFRYIEVNAGHLIISGDRVVPLIRYDTLDCGGVLPAESLDNYVDGSSISETNESLPTLFVFGRGDRAATLYGANIHSEYAQEFLVDPRVAKNVTGRFLMETIYTEAHDQQLLVRIELAPDIEANKTPIGLWTEILSSVLRAKSTEYARIFEEYGNKSRPRIIPQPYLCPKWFPPIHKKYS